MFPKSFISIINRAPRLEMHGFRVIRIRRLKNAGRLENNL